MISHEHQCIFVHIPKTGGTSIENLIWPAERDRTQSNLWMGLVSRYHNKYQTGGLQHLLAHQIRQEVGDKVFTAYFKFAIVRNPWDKAVSQYVYMKKRKDLREYIGMSADDCFKTYLSLIEKKIHVQWESQYKFIFDENDALMVDYVGRFEAFKSDVRKILTELQEKPSSLRKKLRNFAMRFKKIPHTNKSIRSHYSVYYDAESREIVQELYSKDIQLFKYTF